MTGAVFFPFFKDYRFCFAFQREHGAFFSEIYCQLGNPQNIE